jgi:hypothetical protein
MQETIQMAHNSNKGRTISTKGIPRPQARGPRPHVWKAGPDPVEHKKYKVFIQQKNQAQFRDEGWLVTFEEWKQFWDQSGQWENRGRERGTYCMTRQDWSTPWTVKNIVIVPREVHAKMQADAVAGGWRSLAQKKKRTRLGLQP